jgi:Pvc16 N-terminal domain
VSTALAIAATTRVIGALIDKTIQGANASGILGPPPYLTTKAPDQLEGSGPEAAQLSLFLYHVTYNQGWREVGLPSRSASGVTVSSPPLAIDLHYLLIAYGDVEYVPQMMLGLGMSALHETPFLYRQQIDNVFSSPPALSAVDGALATADLAGQVEMIKITPEALTTEDLSKLWTAFGEKFRPTVGYEATVVLIDSTTPAQSALPVTSRNLAVFQLSEPSITGVSPMYLPWAATLSLTLTGANLTGQGTVVVFDNNPGAPQTPGPAGPGGTTITATVPALPAGINTLRVVRQVAIGAPPAKNTAESNVSLFYLQPVIRRDPNHPDDYLITVGSVDSSADPPTTPVTVELDPALQSSQQVQLLLNQLEPAAADAPLSFTFDAQPAQISSNSVTFTTWGAPAGPYLVRVRVDGAESQLNTDPATGAYATPAVTL